MSVESCGKGQNMSQRERLGLDHGELYTDSIIACPQMCSAHYYNVCANTEGGICANIFTGVTINLFQSILRKV